MRRPVLSCFCTEFPRRCLLVPLKRFDKIAKVVKAAAICNFGYGKVCVSYFMCRTFNPVIINVFNGAFAGHAFKIPAKILWRHLGNIRKLLQSYGSVVCLLDMHKHFFKIPDVFAGMAAAVKRVGAVKTAAKY